MKVTKLHIKNFHQFKDLEIDLTYPKGHPNEGEPLSKICFIGQSGTGKTKILETIGGLTHNSDSFVAKYDFKGNKSAVSIKNFDLTYDQSVSQKDGNGYTVFDTRYNDAEIENAQFNEIDKKYISQVKPNLIHYPAELKYEFSDDMPEVNFKEREVIDFSIENATAIWKLVLGDIQKYHEDELKIRQEISRVVEDKMNDIRAIKKALKSLEDLQKSNFNPIKDIAEKYLDPILEKLHLRVKTKFDFQRKEDIGFIKIEDFNGNEIPYGLWSTGTKQIVLSALPLYLLKPNNTIILFDEPERSLYPDLQRIIISYYQNLTTNCQFFFSTHSPIIASSFEPWEIIELKFNAEGYVYQDLYYTGDRHVDNYNISPNYLTYDLILSKVFDLNETYPAVRDEKITEVLMLRNQLEKLKQQDKLKTKDGIALTNRYLKLAKQLSWDFELPANEEA